MNISSSRTTKYTIAVLTYLQRHNHSTNLQIVKGLRDEFPELSKTTVHRVTARLLEQGKIHSAPATHENAVRFDSNVLPHDHFNCRHCDRLRDILVPRTLVEEVQSQLGKCNIDGPITITGICSRCNG
jgi:Fe2+ or Zn2+ uptake regulation protein